jgi:K+-sensing histidine kinase KdpD
VLGHREYLVSTDHTPPASAEDPLRRLVHDLRAPLTVAHGFADLLAKRGDELPAEQRAEFTRRIADALGEMRALLDGAR